MTHFLSILWYELLGIETESWEGGSVAPIFFICSVTFCEFSLDVAQLTFSLCFSRTRAHSQDNASGLGL